MRTFWEKILSSTQDFGVFKYFLFRVKVDPFGATGRKGERCRVWDVFTSPQVSAQARRSTTAKAAPILIFPALLGFNHIRSKKLCTNCGQNIVLCESKQF